MKVRLAGAGLAVGLAVAVGPGAVAAHAVENSRNRETKKMNTSRPMIGPNTAPAGPEVTEVR